MSEHESIEGHLPSHVVSNRAMQLLLVGVDSHFHQYVGNEGGDGAPEQLTAFLREICATYKPDLLAEELSEEIVIESADDSTLRMLATSLALPHLFCDPNDAERRALNIPDQISVQYSKFDGDQKRAAAYMKGFWPIREREWLRRICATDAERCLLVIGASHVETLPVRAAEFGMSMLVLCRRWLPSK